jgi:hypothetical protein
MEKLNELKANLEKLNTDLEIAKKKANDERDKIYATPKYKELEKEYKDIEKQSNKLNEQENKKIAKIKAEFLDGNVHHNSYPYWQSDRWHKNINLEVISAIKKVFQWNKLAGSNVENIVNRMISDRIQNNKKIKLLRDTKQQNRIKSDKIYEKQKKLLAKSDEHFNRFHTLQAEKTAIEKQIAELSIEQQNSKSLKEVGKYARRRALQLYRSECETNYRKVLGVLDKTNGDEQ